MSTEIDHTEVQELLPQYAAHFLNETVHEQVEAHLAGCASCQADLADWRISCFDCHVCFVLFHGL